MTISENLWKGMVGSLQCVVCKRFQPTGQRVELHHIAEGSGVRSDFAIAPLCTEPHKGGSGFHGMGGKKFIMLYRPPGESEYGLLVWTNQDLAERMAYKDYIKVKR